MQGGHEEEVGEHVDSELHLQTISALLPCGRADGGVVDEEVDVGVLGGQALCELKDGGAAVEVDGLQLDVGVRVGGEEGGLEGFAFAETSKGKYEGGVG